MKKTLLVSLAAATLLMNNASAATMYDRFEAMEKEMNKLKAEIADLKAKEKTPTKASMKKDNSDEEDDEDKPVASRSSDDDEEDAEPTVEEKISDMQDSIDNLNKRTGGNHLKFNVDFRTTVENMQYKMADGSTNSSDAFMTNRLWLGMNWAANDNISFTGQLAYNKAYGARSGASTGNSFETFDWITNENAYDDTLRVRSAYFFYKNGTFLGTNIPWTFSLGRRPSTNGHLVNLRDDDPAASPMGHTINVEFDGLSSKFSLEKVTGVNGMYVKFCAGRGGTNAQPKFSAAPYSKDANSINDIDLAGLIFVPYDNGQYKFGTQFYYANNLIDVVTPASTTFENVGGLYSGTVNFVANGIGDEWSDFLDSTIFFISGAWSQTNPYDGKSMLGSTSSEAGYSGWVGLQIPSLISENGKWGIEYNYGSKYWRSITYAEDTNIGSKLATRGNAYEAYFTEPLIDNILSLQIRYTYIDYEYTGSNGFFGGNAAGTTGSGTPFKISELPSNVASNYVDKAQDIRLYLRYRY
ncbi:DUF3373 domain-containing protein [bacterium]|nr:DUF3373 domain-containing protein [bacterium]MBU1882638.1 DUF3373 domain-containing protein [bacterium]